MKAGALFKQDAYWRGADRWTVSELENLVAMWKRGMSVEAIAKHYGVTRERARQVLLDAREMCLGDGTYEMFSRDELIEMNRRATARMLKVHPERACPSLKRQVIEGLSA